MGNDRRLPDTLLSPTCFRHGDYDERPVHRVTITKPFYLAECQVTMHGNVEEWCLDC